MEFGELDNCCGHSCDGKESCCNSINPCGEGGGPCEYDSDCQSDLFCRHKRCLPMPHTNKTMVIALGISIPCFAVIIIIITSIRIYKRK